MWHRAIFNSLGDDGVRSNLNVGDLLNIPICIPSILVQNKISDFLDKKCAEIDSLSEDIQKEIDLLEEYKKSVITEAVTKGLNPDVEMKDSGIEWIGKIPNHWKVKKIKYVSSEISEKKLMTMFDADYIGLENVKGYSNEIMFTDSEYEEGVQKYSHKGNVLFSKLRPYLAKVVICPKDSFTTGEFLELKTKEEISNSFLRYFMLNPMFINEVNLSTYGTKMPRADSAYITNRYTCLPNIEEQNQIAVLLDKKCSEIDKTISEKRQQLEVLAEYKKSLIYEYVTGKKEVI